MQEVLIVGGIETDNCTESWSAKIPEILKLKIDKLSPVQKAEMKQEILLVMARHLHKNDFDPGKYLSTRDN